MSNQKSWFELLGMMTSNDTVDEDFIVRATGGKTCKVLWTFENEEQAQQAFKQWKAECDREKSNQDNALGV